MFKESSKLVDQEALKAQMLNEYQVWHLRVDSRREKIRERIRMYSNITTSQNDTKIYVRLMFSVIDTLLAIYFQDSPKVSFMGRNIDDDELARKLNALADFDYEEMGMEEIDYKSERDRLFFWVSCKMFTWRDSNRKVPIVKRVNPLAMIIDPDWYLSEHRYYWFEVMEDISLLENDPNYFNLDMVESKFNSDLQQDEQAYSNLRYLNVQYRRWQEDPVFEVYHHFTIFQWKKYLTSWANKKRLLIRCVEITPELSEEKKNPNLVEFPVVLKYYKPFEYDPYGISIPDLLEDKQKSLQLFTNLAKVKAEFWAYWDVFLYDENAISNINDLTRRQEGTRYVKADFSINPDPIREVRQPTLSQDDFNIQNLIKQIWQQDTGIDPQTMWVSWDRNITATENQRVQANANLRLELVNKIWSFAEKKFWRLWLRFYKINLKTSSKKVIRVTKTFWSSFIEYGRKDFSTKEDVDIKISTKSEKEALDKKRQMALMTVGMNTLQSWRSEFAKILVERQMYVLNWIPEDEAMQYVPPTIEEMQAKLDLELLSRNEDVWPIENMQEDHMTYIIIYQRSLQTNAKETAIARRIDAYIKSWQQSKDQQAMQQAQWWWVVNQLANASIQQANPQEQNALSLDNV